MKLKALIFSVCIILCSSALCTETNPILEKIDTLYQTRNIPNNLSESLEIINNSLSTEISESLKYELLWRYARQVSAAKNYINNTDKEKLELYEKGLVRCNDALKIKPKAINPIYWHAIVLGRQAELKGVMNSLTSIKPIRNSMNTILDYDPNFSRAYFVLARLYRKAPKVISIGNPKKALKNINIALKLDPNDSIYIIEKAKILLKLKKKEEAIKELKHLILMPIYPNYFKDQVLRDKKEAEQLLDKLTK